MAVAALLWTLSALEAVTRIALHHDAGVVHVVFRLFDLDREGTLSSWFQGALWLAVAAALALIAVLARRTGSPFARHWVVLTGIALFLSADEVAAFHEDLGVQLRERLHAGGALENVWVVPAMALVLVLAFAYRRFFRALPRHTVRRLAIAAAVFLAGAVALEVIGGDISDSHGVNYLPYAIEYQMEEGLEMAGALLALSALMEHREETWPGATLAVE
jgi:hypothetical protein